MINLLQPDSFFAQIPNLTDEELFAFVQAWHEKGETALEIKAFLDYLLERQPPLDTGFKVIDCAGTGGDGANTFNITTCATFIAAAMGARIVKNGGRSTTSQTGSVDVLEALGFDLDMSNTTRLQMLEETRLTFFASKISAELLARVKQVCKQNKSTGFLSLIGPLTSPVVLEAQVIGVGQARWMPVLTKIASLLCKEGKHKGVILVHSSNKDGFHLDELSTVSEAELVEITAQSLNSYKLKPTDLGAKLTAASALHGGEPSYNAELVRQILAGQANRAQTETACLNAALLSYTYDKFALGQDKHQEDLPQYFKQAKTIINNGQAKINFDKLLQINKKNAI